MNYLERAKDAFLTEYPELQVIETCSVDNEIVGYALRRNSDGREFYFTAVQELRSNLVDCASMVFNLASRSYRGLLIRVKEHTYAFNLHEVYDNRKGLFKVGKVVYMRFPIALGVNIKTLADPNVKTLMGAFATKQTTEELFVNQSTQSQSAKEPQ